MKPSNLSEINNAFTEQASGFESDKLHLSKQGYLDYTVRMTVPQRSGKPPEVKELTVTSPALVFI